MFFFWGGGVLMMLTVSPRACGVLGLGVGGRVTQHVERDGEGLRYGGFRVWGGEGYW